MLQKNAHSQAWNMLKANEIQLSILAKIKRWMPTITCSAAYQAYISSVMMWANVQHKIQSKASSIGPFIYSRLILGFHPLDGKFRSRTYMQFYVWVAGMFIPSWIIKISIFRSDKSFSGCRYTLSTSFIFSLNILKCSEVEKYKSHMLLTFV